MMTLTEAPLAPLLNRLFEEADVAEPQIDAAFADLSDEEQARMLRSKTDYGEVYGRMKHLPLPVSRETGTLLYMLARAKARGHRGVRNLLWDLDHSSGGGPARQRRRLAHRQRVRAIETRSCARQPQAGRVIDLVTIREGDALETLRAIYPRVDGVLLDGHKPLYPEILSLLESRLRPGALVVADNADMSPDYLGRVRSQASGYLSVPFAEDVELSMRVGSR